MGKYQLDAKGHASVKKFHEKNSNPDGKKRNPLEEQAQKIELLRKKVRVKNGKKT